MSEEKKLTLRSLFENSESPYEQVEKKEDYITFSDLFKENSVSYPTDKILKAEESKESRLRKLLEKNVTKGLNIQQIKLVMSLIENPQISEDYCVICNDEKKKGWDSELRKSIYNSGLCQNHMRVALNTRKNPYDDSYIKSAIKKITPCEKVYK